MVLSNFVILELVADWWILKQRQEALDVPLIWQ